MVVNLTVMLVLVTMLISVSEGLPKTSYIKMIDVWLVFVLLIPFFEVLVHTTIDFVRTDYEKKVNLKTCSLSSMNEIEIRGENIV